MSLLSINNFSKLLNFELLANQVVEGFITGNHKSPFHGYSVEFSEHRHYNNGESTRDIDWKLYAKTKKLFVKRYEEETNLRCHLIIDNSASMHYPILKNVTISNLNKISFSAVASAALIELLKRQRDAVGLSIYGDKYEYYAPAKGSTRHRRMLLSQLEKLVTEKSTSKTKTNVILHEIAENIHKRSLVFLFTDMFQSDESKEDLFESLRHLKYNKHEVVLFHTFDGKLEYNFDFENSPSKFVDVESGAEINLMADAVQKKYKEAMNIYFNSLKLKCLKYKITYVPVNIHNGFSEVLESYLISRRNFL